jgi:hypothetical protein
MAEKQAKLAKWYEILESNYSRMAQWERDFNKPLPQGSITLALIKLVESKISRLELA